MAWLLLVHRRRLLSTGGLHVLYTGHLSSSFYCTDRSFRVEEFFVLQKLTETVLVIRSMIVFLVDLKVHLYCAMNMSY